MQQKCQRCGELFTQTGYERWCEECKNGKELPKETRPLRQGKISYSEVCPICLNTFEPIHSEQTCCSYQCAKEYKEKHHKTA